MRGRKLVASRIRFKRISVWAPRCSTKSCCGGRIVSTGQGASAIISSAVEPHNARARPRRPWLRRSPDRCHSRAPLWLSRARVRPRTITGSTSRPSNSGSGKQTLHLAAQLQQPVCFLLLQHAFRQSHQVWRNGAGLDAEQNDSAAPLASKGGGILKRRTRVRVKSVGKKNVSERHDAKNLVLRS